MSLQINHYNTIGNGKPWHSSWYQLDLMQMYLNNVRFLPPLAIQPIEAVDYGTAEFVENYAVDHRRGGTSIFDPEYVDELVYWLASGMSWDEFEQEESYLIDEAERIRNN